MARRKEEIKAQISCSRSFRWWRFWKCSYPNWLIQVQLASSGASKGGRAEIALYISVSLESSADRWGGPVCTVGEMMLEQAVSLPRRWSKVHAHCRNSLAAFGNCVLSQCFEAHNRVTTTTRLLALSPSFSCTHSRLDSYAAQNSRRCLLPCK